MVEVSQKTPNGLAVELYFDSKMESEICEFRESIYQQGIDPVLGRLGDRPHISLAVFSDADPVFLKQVTKEFAKNLISFPIRLEAIGTFPTMDNVLYLAPVPSEQLLKVHREFHKILKVEKLHSSTYYSPDLWVPHCTFEYGLPEQQFLLALGLCKQYFKPIKGQFTELGVVAFRPIEYLVEYPLQVKE
jgi:2'-5' RNA ligase